MIKQFTILADKWPKAEKSIIKLNHLAEKLGNEPMRYEVVESKSIRYTVPRLEGNVLYYEIGKAPEIELQALVVSVTIPFEGAMKLRDREIRLLGNIERIEDNKNLVNVFDDRLDFSEYKQTPMTQCDHCGHKRKRNQVYIVSDNGEIKLVGSTCLLDYLGHKNNVDFIMGLAAIGPIINCNEPSFEGDYSRDALVYRTAPILKQYFALWLTYGYNKESFKFDIFNDKVMKIVNDDADRLAKADALYQEFMALINTQEENNQFIYNLKLLSNSECLKWKHLGLIAYAPEWLSKNRPKTFNSNEWLGTKGDILRSIQVNLVSIKTIPSYYGDGPTYLHNFEDKNGNCLSWFTNTTKLLDKVSQDLIISGTVKDLKEFRGRKQTLLSRVREA